MARLQIIDLKQLESSCKSLCWQVNSLNSFFYTSSLAIRSTQIFKGWEQLWTKQASAGEGAPILPPHTLFRTCHSKLPKYWGYCPFTLSHDTHLMVDPAHRSDDSCVLYLLAILNAVKIPLQGWLHPSTFFIIFLSSLTFIPTKLCSLRPDASTILFSTTFWQSIFLHYEKDYIYSLK